MYIVVLVIIAVIIVLGIVYLQEASAKSELKAFLMGKGFQDVKISASWFVGSKSTLYFEVEYRDNNGELQKNSCVTNTGAFSDQKFYWEKPLE